jgi:hypothetical protein
MSNKEALQRLFAAAQAGVSFEDALAEIRDTALVQEDGELLLISANPAEMLNGIMSLVHCTDIPSVEVLGELQACAILEIFDWMDDYRLLDFDEVVNVTGNSFERSVMIGYWLGAMDIYHKRAEETGISHHNMGGGLEMEMGMESISDDDDAAPVPAREVTSEQVIQVFRDMKAISIEDTTPVVETIHPRGWNPHVVTLDEQSTVNAQVMEDVRSIINAVPVSLPQVDLDLTTEDAVESIVISEVSMEAAVSGNPSITEHVPQVRMETIRWFVNGEELAAWKGEEYSPELHGKWKDGEIYEFPSSLEELKMVEGAPEVERINADKKRVEWLVQNHARRSADVGVYYPQLYAYLDTRVEYIRVPRDILCRVHNLDTRRNKYRKEVDVKNYEMRNPRKELQRPSLELSR